MHGGDEPSPRAPARCCCCCSLALGHLMQGRRVASALGTWHVTASQFLMCTHGGRRARAGPPPLLALALEPRSPTGRQPAPSAPPLGLLAALCDRVEDRLRLGCATRGDLLRVEVDGVRLHAGRLGQDALHSARAAVAHHRHLKGGGQQSGGMGQGARQVDTSTSAGAAACTQRGRGVPARQRSRQANDPRKHAARRGWLASCCVRCACRTPCGCGLCCSPWGDAGRVQGGHVCEACRGGVVHDWPQPSATGRV